MIAKISPVSPESPLKEKDLNNFFAKLPSLGEDAEVLAKELTEIRKQIPTESNLWD